MGQKKGDKKKEIICKNKGKTWVMKTKRCIKKRSRSKKNGVDQAKEDCKRKRKKGWTWNKKFNTCVKKRNSSSNSSRRAREAAHEEDIAPMDAVQQLMGFQGRHLGKREIRAKRATYTCASMTTAVQTCTTAMGSTPSGSTVISSCTIETTQTSITCTDDEKTALQTISNTLLVAQRIFTAFSISILSELSESAGATPSSSELESLVNEITPGTSTKAASSRNRNMLRQMVLDKMKN